MAVSLSGPGLNPAQQGVLDALSASRGDRPAFEPGLGASLRSELEEALTPAVAALDELDQAQLWITKHTVSSVLGCEARFVAEQEAGFDGWTVARAKGTVAHRAIETSMHVRGEPVPAELVDHAIARLAEGEANGLAEWLQALSELERADLRSAAVDKVSAFLETWPPLSARWRPRSESRVRVELCDDRIILAGKVDLTLGAAEGTTAGKVLIDLKTGGFNPAHIDDLRFYALVETMKIGVPPRRLASHYLESGRLVPEDVTVALLAAATHRTVAAVDRWIALRRGDREPARMTGPACRWCPIAEQCEPGQAHLAATDDW